MQSKQTPVLLGKPFKTQAPSTAQPNTQPQKINEHKCYLLTKPKKND